MFLPGYTPLAIADWSIIVQCHLLVKHGFSVYGAVAEMGVLSTLKRLLMESTSRTALLSHLKLTNCSQTREGVQLKEQSGWFPPTCVHCLPCKSWTWTLDIGHRKYGLRLVALHRLEITRIMESNWVPFFRHPTRSPIRRVLRFAVVKGAVRGKATVSII
jgi:hypothetical protein